ncbi:MAG: hypothetical protein JWR50_4334 [Mucilaginibacter sp.]|nr:hypothetical protein [Mucilaginibacter sp.]
MPTYRYTLEPYKNSKSRYSCPDCEAPKKFTRYIDTETNLHLADHVGKCDREESCGYHFTPKQFFEAHPKNFKLPQPRKIKPAPVLLRPGFIPKKLYQKSLKHYEKNDFVEYLSGLFDRKTLDNLIEDYHIGTAKHWPHATIFWQVDRKANVRTGKIMLYDPYTGKRVKQPYAHIAWVHTLLKEPDFNLKQCFFGEDLIYPGCKQIVAIVESEKTAVIAAGFMPDYIWVAAGSLEGLTYEKCRVLHGMDVILFPDADAYPKWEAKAKQLRIKLPGTRFGIADYLADVPPEQRTPGMDIADWLIATQQPEPAPMPTTLSTPGIVEGEEDLAEINKK